MLVILMLTQKGNSRLGIVLVKHGHVQVINELKELVLAEGSKSATSLLFKHGLELSLEEGRISVVIEIDDLRKIIITCSGHLKEETLNNLSLTATSVTDQKR